jgi:hypothetical protein
MTYYHGSRKLFEKGFLLAPQADGYAKNPEVASLEALFESRRPQGKTARSNSVYLVTDPDLIDASGGYNDAVYTVKPRSVPEESDLAWYSEAHCELETDPPNMDRITTCIDNYWAGTPFPDEDRRCPEYRTKWAEVTSLFELNVDHGDLERISSGNDLTR